MTLRTILRQRVLPAVAAACVVALLAAGAWYGYSALASRPVKEVVLGGDVDRLPPQIVAEFTRELERRTVGTSLASVRENAKRIPWVRDASVRRKFPDAIEVQFEIHEPLAQLGKLPVAAAVTAWAVRLWQDATAPQAPVFDDLRPFDEF